jgi:hypothetical protein
VEGFKVIASSATGAVITKLSVLCVAYCIASSHPTPPAIAPSLLPAHSPFSPQAVLLQLLQTEDERELAAVHAALSASLQRDAPATLAALLEPPAAPAAAGPDAAAADALRARAVAFLTAALAPPPRAAELLRRGDDAERAVAALVRRCLAPPGGPAPVPPAEFALFAQLLLPLDMFRAAGGGETLLEVVPWAGPSSS